PPAAAPGQTPPPAPPAPQPAPGSAAKPPAAQTPANPPAQTTPGTLAAPSDTGQNRQPGVAAPATPVTIDLAGALEKARAYNAQFQAAVIATGLAREDRLQAKAALLPSLNYFNQYIYTQGNGTPSGVFVANDGVHVYTSQAQVHEELFSFTRRAEYRRALAAEATAKAKQEIAARGLISTVVGAYYGLLAARHHLANAQRSLDEARHFLDITEKQERGGEVAHADVIKARLQAQQRERDLWEAQYALDKAQMALGVLLSPDVNQQFNIQDDLQSGVALAPFPEIQQMALSNSPDVKAAEAGLRQAEVGISVAQGAYLPALVLDYFYGINANVFGIRGPEDRKNLGSSVQATMTIPVWNWGATQSKVRQAILQRKQAQLDLLTAQRQLQANLNNSYLEAQTARAQLDSLRSSVELSVESLRLTLLRYQGGEATALEVVDAQTTLAQARNAYDDGLTRYRVALAGLQTLTGTI
ncbi:MAG: TolC family protein, partial [Acidobacteriota bacterium]|nr:TolC family protein [Acidobacteriota bacterium]